MHIIQAAHVLASCDGQPSLWSRDGHIFADRTGHWVVIETEAAAACGAHIMCLEPLYDVKGMATMSTGQAETGRTCQCKTGRVTVMSMYTNISNKTGRVTVMSMYTNSSNKTGRVTVMSMYTNSSNKTGRVTVMSMYTNSSNKTGRVTVMSMYT